MKTTTILPATIALAIISFGIQPASEAASRRHSLQQSLPYSQTTPLPV